LLAGNIVVRKISQEDQLLVVVTIELKLVLGLSLKFTQQMVVSPVTMLVSSVREILREKELFLVGTTVG
jgi:hypothetical protein